jgi:DNA end-binding protein Ku
MVQVSLVQFGISLFTATESKSGISFNQISRATGERIRLQKTAGEDGTTLAKDDIVKGFEYAKGKYVIVEPSELDSLKVASKHTIEVSQFVSMAELNPELIEKPYFVLPQNDGQAEAFAVVRQALLNTGKVAIGKITLLGRESIIAIAPAEDRGMMAYIVRYESEIRSRRDYFRDIKEAAINADVLEMAELLIGKRTAPFDPSKFVDGYEVAVREMIDAKVTGKPMTDTAAPKPNNFIHLMDALRQSVGESAPAPAPEAAPAKKAPKKAAAKATKGLGDDSMRTIDERLARLKRYRSRYEVAMIHLATGERKLVVYMAARSFRQLVDAIRERLDAVRQAAGSEDVRIDDHKLFAGDYRIDFTGRTQRESILNGELPFIGKKVEAA